MKSDIIQPGKIVGKWLVLARRRHYAECVCSCGAVKPVWVFNLINGKSVSCGCFRAQSNKLRSGPASATWKGGKTLSSSGYILVRLDPGKRAKRILEHRAVMSAMLGRALLSSETVHHKNGIKTDNRPDNLELWGTNHSGGQRIADRISDAVSVLKAYAPELLR